MSFLWITLLLSAGAALESMLPAWAFIGSMEWPFLTALIIYIALRVERSRVVYASLLAGLLYDALSPAPLGMALPFFILLGIGIHALGEEVFADQIVTYSLLGMLTVVCKTIYFAAALSLSGLRTISLQLLAIRLGGALVLGALTVPAVYVAVSFLRRGAPKRRRNAWS